MCGIFGIISNEDVTQRVVEALERLEYRGYDSAGIAVIQNSRLVSRRVSGRISSLNRLLSQKPIAGTIGIGHTRWATHGAPVEKNAHPHSTDQVAVVHNGVIENYSPLRDELESQGHVFTTDTDTEVIVHLCTDFLKRGLAPVDAISATIARLDGAFAVCLLFSGDENLLVAARRGSPLAIGYGNNGEVFTGSDALALAPLTNRITYLEEGDWACLRRGGDIRIYDSTGQLVQRPIRVISVSSVLVDKGEYRHFMAKEIHEQPTVLGYALASHMNHVTTDRWDELDDAGIDFSKIDHITIVGCGTANYAGCIARYWLETIAQVKVSCEIASEFRYTSPLLSAETGLVFLVSQSGETADTLAALRNAKEHGLRTVSIVNAVESSIARDADVVLQIFAGPEISVASTKTFTCQLACLLAVALYAAKKRKVLSASHEEHIKKISMEVPRLINDILAREQIFVDLGHELERARHALYLGRGAMYPLALEGALKLKEISYIHAEGYACSELKHGPISLIDAFMPVIVFAGRDKLFNKTVSNIQEIIARDAQVVLISDKKGIESAKLQTWKTVEMPEVDEIVAPIIYAIPAQLIAYHTAVAKGTDVDQPRHLAKSVTVE